MEDGHEVGTIVHGHVRLHVEDGVDVAVVAVGVLSPHGEDGDPGLHQCRRHVVLRRQRVGGAQRHLGPQVTQRQHEVGGLGGHVQTGGHGPSGEWLVAGGVVSHLGQDRHAAGSPLDTEEAVRGQIAIFDVVFHGSSSRVRSSLWT